MFSDSVTGSGIIEHLHFELFATTGRWGSLSHLFLTSVPQI